MPNPHVRVLTRFWAVVFAIFGLGVALAPDLVARLIAWEGALVGLDGPVEPGKLVHALAISLMACITVGAWTGDADRALMAAKLTSTAAFAWLALRAPAWWVAAAADGFVALTLAIAARRGPPALLHRWVARVGGGSPARAWARARRLPEDLVGVTAIVDDAIEWLGPLLLLGRPARASTLSDADFDRLHEALLHHRWAAVRGAAVLARSPVAETRWPGETPPDPGHPLANRPRPRGERFDVIVIGSGAGGAPLAWRLARNGLSVGVVEAGDLVRPRAPEAAVERHYVAQGTVAATGGGIVLAASAVGGTTALNSGTCLRPLPARLAEWDAAAGTDFATGALDPWLDEVEAHIGVGVPPRTLLPEVTRRFGDGLARLGRDGAFVLPRNSPDCAGIGLCCFGCPAGAKRSTDRSFLPGALDAGAELFSRTRATRVRVDGEVRVEVEGPEGARTLRAGRLAVAAGALGTPAILRANRLGAWRKAGDALRLHPATKVTAVFGEPVGGHGVPQGLGYLPPEHPRVTLEAIHVPAPSLAPVLCAAGERHGWWMDRFDRHGTFGVMIHDRGEGRLRHVAGRPVPFYSLHPEDAADMAAGVRLCARAWLAAGAERVLLPVLGAPNEAGSVAELDALAFDARHLQWAAFHPQGTAGIGRVVSADLRLAERVDVCDASVLPGSPGANPQLTIMALSLRLADRILA
ncbi:MAG: GMC family oxidoreductase N-terminal domain-containing protein [Myxococcota bacterium]